jgi:drug/metabolite transporter (DMT)-like permease
MVKGVLYALLAALLFGASTPLAKVLLPQVAPVLMAELLYLGSGVGLAGYWLVRDRRNTAGQQEAQLARRDWPWLAGAIAAGGVIGPVLLMWGLARTPASNAALLLNLEGVLTALLAWFVFKENFDVRIALGMALIAAGGACLSWVGRPEVGLPWSSLAIVGACLAWAIDNHLTRKVSAGDPMQIAMLKGLVAGTVNTATALVPGGQTPCLAVTAGTGRGGFLRLRPQPHSVRARFAARWDGANRCLFLHCSVHRRGHFHLVLGGHADHRVRRGGGAHGHRRLVTFDGAPRTQAPP